MEEYRYTLECPSCQADIEMIVRNEDEFPVFCSMCGEDVNEKWTIDD